MTVVQVFSSYKKQQCGGKLSLLLIKVGINYPTLQYRESKFGQVLNRKNIEINVGEIRSKKGKDPQTVKGSLRDGCPSHLKDTIKSKWEIAIGII